jgi:hypothetical protein
MASQISDRLRHLAGDTSPMPMVHLHHPVILGWRENRFSLLSPISTGPTAVL